MKKAGYILLLFILFLQAGGILFVYRIQQIALHQLIQLKLDSVKTGFVRIILSNEEYQISRIKRNEVKVGGKMYDVKSIHRKGDKVELIVIRDLKEEHILAKINDLTQGWKHRNSRITELLKQLISLRYLPLENENDLIDHSFAISSYPVLIVNPVSADTKNSIPPPKQV